MRIAAVVLPVCTIAAAAALTAFQLHRKAPTRRAPAPAVAALAVAVPATPVIKPPPAPPKYAAPVGGQFLTAWSDLLLGEGDAPPLLFMLRSDDLDGYRYGWRMPRVAEAMASELTAVLDDACGSRCPPAADRARTAAHAFVDASDRTDDAAHTRAWDSDAEGISTHLRRIALRSRAGARSLDVVCTCASWTVGMRMWNDITTCDATLRDAHGVVAIYRPRVLARSNKESIEEPIDAYDQMVVLPGLGTLVTETGWDYAGDNVTTPLAKTTPRTGPHWR
jgi:hypothetical protein